MGKMGLEFLPEREAEPYVPVGAVETFRDIEPYTLPDRESDANVGLESIENEKVLLKGRAPDIEEE